MQGLENWRLLEERATHGERCVNSSAILLGRSLLLNRESE